MKVMFNVPLIEDVDIEELSEEDLAEVATDYFFNKGCHEADYDFEFDFDI